MDNNLTVFEKVSLICENLYLGHNFYYILADLEERDADFRSYTVFNGKNSNLYAIDVQFPFSERIVHITFDDDKKCTSVSLY